LATSPATPPQSPPVQQQQQQQQQKLIFHTDEATGVMVADIRLGGKTTIPTMTRPTTSATRPTTSATTSMTRTTTGAPLYHADNEDARQQQQQQAVEVVQANSKVNVHMVGRLLGKNGWIFLNSRQEDGNNNAGNADNGGEPYRLSLGTGTVIPGLEVGLLGMAEGGKRRIVIPSSQGYNSKNTPVQQQQQLEPIPRDFGNRQRLYTTVLNSVRVDRERDLLGSGEGIAGELVFDVELLRIR
jgi:FKBP-type peptidyl-prolyl cis-trans isomerase